MHLYFSTLLLTIILVSKEEKDSHLPVGLCGEGWRSSWKQTSEGMACFTGLQIRTDEPSLGGSWGRLSVCVWACVCVYEHMCTKSNWQGSQNHRLVLRQGKGTGQWTVAGMVQSSGQLSLSPRPFHAVFLENWREFPTTTPPQPWCSLTEREK